MMSNKLDITIYDFENICRTCLSRDDLNPLYEKCSRSTCLADMLMSCTFLKFTEDDGLPMSICGNCINEINQAFLFTKRCEIIDTILRKCVIKSETEIACNLSQSQKVEPAIKAEEEMKTEIKPEIFSNMHQVVKDVLNDYEYLDQDKQEQDMKIEYVEKNELADDVEIKYEERAEEVKQEVDAKIEYESDATYDDPADVGFEEQDETCSEKSDNAARRRSDKCQTNRENSKKKDDVPAAKRKNKKINLNGNFQCAKCDQEFTTKALLQQHMKIYSEVKNTSCGVCNKVFAQSSYVKYHMRIHTEEKPHICAVCNKTFSQSSHLKLHMKIHTGEKPHICSVCNKVFAQPNHVKYHMRLHTGERPHICGVCNEGFSRANKLKVHMRSHIGEKQF